jgi:hypothetical protein
LVIPVENDVLVDVVHTVIQIQNVVVLQKQPVDDVAMKIGIRAAGEVKQMERKLDDVFELDNDDENVKMMMEDWDDVCELLMVVNDEWIDELDFHSNVLVVDLVEIY